MSIGVLDRLEDVEDVRKRVADGLTGVSRVVVVMSGKGGVGKRAVSVNLAEAMAMQGLSVGILDADLQGPTVAKMLGLRGRPVRVAGDLGLEPAAGPSGVVVQSMDFFLQGAQALDWDGRDGAGATLRSAFEHAALADLLGQTHWGELDLLVVDLPPGADRLPAFAQWLPGHLGEGLAVTIPTEVALLAVGRSLRRALDLRQGRNPVLGAEERTEEGDVPLVRGQGRVVRGGGFNFISAAARSANRGPGDPDTRVQSVGFRPAMRLSD